MKHFYTLLAIVCVAATGWTQIPANYYDSANGLSGYALKTELRNIISNGHNDQGYGALYTGYQTTHSDNIPESGYENDNTVLLFYTENPNGTDPYTYNHGQDQCGNYNAESVCHNREHLIPQSTFNSASPMQNDIHHVIPSDGFVNGQRGSLPFGIVGSANWTSQNGSKRGNSNVSGYSGVVFEPIDEFKGDIARALLYFAVRYQDNVDNYNWEMFNGTEDQVFETWAIDMLLDWHYNVDPVDQREIDRNNAAYNFQGNANPFVDHPEYVNIIWNPSPDNVAPSDPTNLVASNPTNNTIDLSWTASTDNVAVESYDIYINAVFSFNTGNNNTNTTATGLLPETIYCFTIKAKDAAGNESGFSNESCETTLDNGSSLNCIDENFENIPDSSGSYLERNWTGNNGIMWTATDARTDQTLDGRAITIRNGTLQPSTLNSDYIEELTVTTQRVFGGSSGTFDLVINGNVVGTIPYNDTPTTTTINVDINMVSSLIINNNSTPSNRVMFDNLSWTCGLLSIEDFSINDVKLYPNPVTSNLNINIANEQSTKIEIYDILGKRVHNTTLSSSTSLNLQNLKAGVYIVKLIQNNKTISKRLVKN
ncbi:endonuclease [Winogradskyella sp.]|jgi:endonuclease I|uniref:endonuclease n=1 Tax=Winogradskyella sp. TaxID=1883156 RepID=UPI0025FFCD46|nr:endonuclease [Winogradskyella sp.]MCT4628705.1 endonuclease [Winogradskyella sp.]